VSGGSLSLYAREGITADNTTLTLGRWDHTIPIAPLATRGLPIALQGASGPGLDVRLTTPAVVVLN
jgi:hypothetical protein